MTDSVGTDAASTKTRESIVLEDFHGSSSGLIRGVNS